eukprot:COSAG01_NODE_158_length_23708_cov_7.921979_8_plen_424_part_00
MHGATPRRAAGARPGRAPTRRSGPESRRAIPNGATKMAADARTRRLSAIVAIATVCSVAMGGGRFFSAGSQPKEHHRARATMERVQASERALPQESAAPRTHAEGKGRPLHLMELFQQAHGGAPTSHPQDYAPLRQVPASQVYPGAGAPAAGTITQHRRHRRRLQGTTVGVLDEASTVPLKIHVDWSQTDPATAKPYTVCFKVGDWFMWNTPSSSGPPCGNAAAHVPHTLSAFAAAQAAADGVTPCPGQSLGATLCDRNARAAGQNCWGVCVADDALDHSGSMLQWMKSEVAAAVSELEGFFQTRRRTANLTFTKDHGLFASQLGLGPPGEMCAKDANVVYQLPISDAYCTVGVDADVVCVGCCSVNARDILCAVCLVCLVCAVCVECAVCSWQCPALQVFVPMMMPKQQGVAGWGAWMMTGD